MSTTITHKRLTNALVKIGCVVKNAEKFRNDGKPSQTWVATNPKNNKCVEWYVQPAFVPAKDGAEHYYDENNLVTTFVVMRSPHTDIMTDYFADSFFHSIKSVVEVMA